MNGKPTPTIKAWKAALKDLVYLGTGNVYGGRGQPASITVAVAQQIAYLDRADHIVSAYVKELGSRRPELTNPADSGAHFTAIQGKFAKTFPDHALPDLVGYGVYGLALSKIPETKLPK